MPRYTRKFLKKRKNKMNIIEENITYREIIKRFMNMKDAQINKHYIVLGAYFHIADRKAIDNWDEEKAKEVVEIIVENIKIYINIYKRKGRFEFLSYSFCPFCLYHKSKCNECEYRKEHGDCRSFSSEYKKIIRYFEKKEKSTFDIFPIEWIEDTLAYLETLLQQKESEMFRKKKKKERRLVLHEVKDPVTYQDIIISYMWMKHNKIIETFDYENYFYVEDEEAIKNDWTDEDAKKVLETLYNNLQLGNVNILSNGMCPFCIHKMLKEYSCAECTYSYLHGKCNNSISTYSDLINIVKGGFSNVNFVQECKTRIDELLKRKEESKSVKFKAGDRVRIKENIIDIAADRSCIGKIYTLKKYDKIPGHIEKMWVVNESTESNRLYFPEECLELVKEPEKVELTEIEAVRISMEMWKWLKNNPTKWKSNYPNYREYGINNMKFECPLCEYYDMDCDMCVLNEVERESKVLCRSNDTFTWYKDWLNQRKKNDAATYIFYALEQKYNELSNEVEKDVSGYKIYVKNENINKRVQESAFNQGYRWLFHSSSYQNTSAKFLFFNKIHKNITYVVERKFFEKHSYKELTVDQFLEMEKKENFKKSCYTVEKKEEEVSVKKPDCEKYNYRIVTLNNFLINYETLVDKDACQESLKWFVKEYGNKSTTKDELKERLNKIGKENWAVWVDVNIKNESIRESNFLCIDDVDSKNKGIFILEDTVNENIYFYVKDEGFKNLYNYNKKYTEQTTNIKTYFRKIIKNKNMYNVYYFIEFSDFVKWYLEVFEKKSSKYW